MRSPKRGLALSLSWLTIESGHREVPVIRLVVLVSIAGCAPSGGSSEKKSLEGVDVAKTAPEGRDVRA